MKRYLTLFLKELKGLSAVFFMLTATYLFFVLYLLYTDISQILAESAFNVRSSLQAFMTISLLIFPGILFYTFYEGRAQHTVYQAQAIPVPRYMLLLLRFLTLLSISVFIAVLLSLCNAVIDLKIIALYFRDEGIYRNPVTGAFRFFTLGYVMLGIGVLVTAVLSVIKRNHVIVGIAGFFLMLVFNVYLTKMFNISVLYNTVSMDFHAENSPEYTANIVFQLLPGTVYLLSGLFIYHRYSDM